MQSICHPAGGSVVMLVSLIRQVGFVKLVFFLLKEKVWMYKKCIMKICYTVACENMWSCLTVTRDRISISFLLFLPFMFPVLWLSILVIEKANTIYNGLILTDLTSELCACLSKCSLVEYIWFFHQFWPTLTTVSSRCQAAVNTRDNY